MPKSIVKASPELLGMLNQAIAREMQVAIQYMWQHVQWSGVKGMAVRGEFQSIAVQEMKHAEAIAERLFYLGGTPSTKPAPVFVGTTLAEMVAQDIADETGTILLYQKIIARARLEGDETTQQLFREMLATEEGHHDTFVTLQEEL